MVRAVLPQLHRVDDGEIIPSEQLVDQLVIVPVLGDSLVGVEFVAQCPLQCPVDLL